MNILPTMVQPDTRSRAYAIAACAGVDHRPVAAWLGGAPLPRGAVGERIAAAAEALGLVSHGTAPRAPATPLDVATLPEPPRPIPVPPPPAVDLSAFDRQHVAAIRAALSSLTRGRNVRRLHAQNLLDEAELDGDAMQAAEAVLDEAGWARDGDGWARG